MAGSSFVDPGKMRSQIASTKAREELEKKEAERKEEAEAKKQEEAKAKAEGKDPVTGADTEEERYPTVWGLVTADELLEKYPSIRDMVRDKRYFLSGYATETVEFGGMKIGFRTLKKSEQRLCTMLAEDDSRHPVTGDVILVPDEFLRWQLLMMIKSVGGEDWDDLAIPSVSSAKRFKADSDKEIEAFCKSDEVMRRLNVINEWPEHLYNKLTQHSQAIILAYSVAIEKDLANP